MPKAIMRMFAKRVVLQVRFVPMTVKGVEGRRR